MTERNYNDIVDYVNKSSTTELRNLYRITNLLIKGKGKAYDQLSQWIKSGQKEQMTDEQVAEYLDSIGA